MNTITTPNGNKMSAVDNDRLASFNTAILELGDQVEAIKDLDLKSPQARTALRNAEAMLFNAQTFLKASFDAEYKLAVRKAK